MDQPSRSPDLAPADLWLFPEIKNEPTGKHFPALKTLYRKAAAGA
jgi:hypothetical protein